MKKAFNTAFYVLLALGLLVGCYPQQQAKKTTVPRESAFRFYENALVAKFDGHWQQALQDINQAIALNQRISLFYVLKAQIFDSLHQVDSAIFAYQQALQSRPHASDILQKIGELYVKKGQPLNGIRYLKKAFSYAETQTDILLRIAELYLDLDSLQLADAVLTDYKIRRDLARQKPEPSYFLMKADLAYARKDFEQAAHYYALCPCKKCFTRQEALRAFSVLFRLKKYDAYFALLTGVEKDTFKNGELFYYRGLYYRVIGNLTEAQHQFELALKHGNAMPQLFWELARIYYRTKRRAEIQKLYEQLKKVAPDSPFVQKIRALF